MNSQSFQDILTQQISPSQNYDLAELLVKAIQSLNETSQNLNQTTKNLGQFMHANQHQNIQTVSHNSKGGAQGTQSLRSGALQPPSSQPLPVSHHENGGRSRSHHNKFRSRSPMIKNGGFQAQYTGPSNQAPKEAKALPFAPYDWGYMHRDEDSSILRLEEASNVTDENKLQVNGQKKLFILDCIYILLNLHGESLYIKDTRIMTDKALSESSDYDVESSQKEALSWSVRKDVTLLHALLTARISCPITKSITTQRAESPKRMIFVDEFCLMKHIVNNRYHKRWICVYCQLPEKFFRVDKFCKNTREHCVLRSITFIYSFHPLNEAAKSDKQSPSSHLSLLIDCTATFRYNMELREDLSCLMIAMMDPGFQRFVFISNHAELSQLNARAIIKEGIKTGLYTHPEIKKNYDKSHK